MNVLRAQPALGAAAGAAAATAASALLEAEPSWLARVQAAWVRDEVSNYEYLLYLNLAAGRSFSDLTQWPVFPWVLSDYSSPALDLSSATSFRDLAKPVGALNPQRLAGLRERARQMAGAGGEKPFLYGTHYSTPGYTLFWLLRALPGHALRLQGGRFDAPDRLFCSVREAWEGVLRAPADVKELVPEFYAPPAEGAAWLQNRLGLPLGARQSGQPVGDVALPPWATSPAHFLACMRAALEAPHTSERLHLWIDLIFGIAQRGEAAVARDNVFHPLTYEGAVDLDTITDPAQRAATLQQIDEFGQTPRQLFRSAHPQRAARPAQQLPLPDAPLHESSSRSGAAALVRMLLVRTLRSTAGRCTRSRPRLQAVAASGAAPPGSGLQAATAHAPHTPAAAMLTQAPPPASVPAAAAPAVSRHAVASMGALRLPRLRLPRSTAAAPPLWSMRAHRGGGAALALSADAAYSCGRDAWLRVRSLADSSPLHAAQLGRLPLSCLALLPPPPLAPAGSRPGCLAGSLDGCVYLASVDYGALLGRLAAHDDAVSALALPAAAGGARLVTASWDGMLKLWDIAGGRALDGGSAPPVPLLELSSQEGAICALCSSADGARLLSGGRDGCVALWDARAPPTSGPAWQVSACPSGVTQLDCSEDGSLVTAAGEDGFLRLLDTRRGGSLGAQVDAAHGMAVRCVHLAGATLLAGTDGGELVAWDMQRAAPGLLQPPRGSGLVGGAGGEPLWRARLGDGAPVRAVFASPGGSPMVGALSADGWLHVYASDGWEGNKAT